MPVRQQGTAVEKEEESSVAIQRALGERTCVAGLLARSSGERLVYHQLISTRRYVNTSEHIDNMNTIT